MDWEYMDERHHEILEDFCQVIPWSMDEEVWFKRKGDLIFAYQTNGSGEAVWSPTDGWKEI